MCGAYAFFNLTFPPRKPLRKGYKTRPTVSRARLSYRSVLDGERIPLRRYDRQGLGADLRDQSQLRLPSRSPAKQNEKRSRWTFAVLVFFLFACFALGGAIVGSAIIGYVAAGLFKAARYNMSTYVFLYNHFAGRSGPPPDSQHIGTSARHVCVLRWRNMDGSSLLSRLGGLAHSTPA